MTEPHAVDVPETEPYRSILAAAKARGFETVADLIEAHDRQSLFYRSPEFAELQLHARYWRIVRERVSTIDLAGEIYSARETSYNSREQGCTETLMAAFVADNPEAGE